MDVGNIWKTLQPFGILDAGIYTIVYSPEEVTERFRKGFFYRIWGLNSCWE